MTMQAAEGATTTTEGTAAPAKSEFASELVPTAHDDLMAAVKEARAANGETVETVEGAEVVAEPAKEDKPPKVDETADTLSALERKIRAREKDRAKTVEIEKRAAEIAQREEAAKRQIGEVEQLKKQLTEQMNAFQANPLEYLQKNGVDREKIAESFVKSGTPEYQLAQKLEASERKLDKVMKYLEHREQLEAQSKEEASRQSAQQSRKRAEADFMKECSSDVAPNLHRVAELTGQGEAYIISKADRVAEWFKQETGAYPSFTEIAEYLEHEASTKLTGLGVKLQSPKSAGKPKATTRTLSAERSSERRSADKPSADLSAAELQAEMIRAVAEARRAG